RKTDRQEINTMNQRTTLPITTMAFLCLGIAFFPSNGRPAKDPQRTNRRTLDIGLGVRPDRGRRKARTMGGWRKRGGHVRWPRTLFLDDHVSQPSKSGHQSAHPSWTSNRLLGHLYDRRGGKD